jgi:hypothetical protein
MPIPEKQPPAKDRRVVPRHLRDSEHDPVASTSVAGTRAEDAAQSRARGWVMWLALVAVATATVWWWLQD